MKKPFIYALVAAISLMTAGCSTPQARGPSSASPMIPALPDFDPSLTVISADGSSRGTAYSMNPKMIRTRKFLHLTYLARGEIIYVKSMNLITQTWSEPVLIGQGQDNHAAPALLIDHEGYLHIIYGPHHGEFQYRRSLRPNDSSAWTPITRFGVAGTYASPVIDRTGTIHLVYRGGGYPRQLVYQRKAKTSNWSDPVILVDGDPDYMISYNDSLAIAPDQSLHIGFLFFHQYKSQGHKVGYMKSIDGGQTWVQSGGASSTLPVTLSTAETIMSDPTGYIGVANIAVDRKNNVYFPIHHLKESPRKLTLVKATPVPGKAAILTSIPLDTFAPRGDFDGVSSLSITQNPETLWLAASFSNLRAPWGSGTTGIAILTVPTEQFSLSESKIVSTIEPLQSPARPGLNDASWHPSLERPVGQNSMPSVPLLLFTSGSGNRDNGLGTEIPTRIILKNLMAR